MPGQLFACWGTYFPDTTDDAGCVGGHSNPIGQSCMESKYQTCKQLPRQLSLLVLGVRGHFVQCIDPRWWHVATQHRCSCTAHPIHNPPLSANQLPDFSSSWIVFSSSVAGVAGKKGQGGCHEQYRKGMINRSFAHIAGLPSRWHRRHLEHLLLPAPPPTQPRVRLKRTTSCARGRGLSLTFDTPRAN